MTVVPILSCLSCLSGVHTPHLLLSPIDPLLGMHKKGPEREDKLSGDEFEGEPREDSAKPQTSDLHSSGASHQQLGACADDPCKLKLG